MHESLAHFLTVGLFLILLALVTHTRRDDRFRCWLAAWLSVLSYYGAITLLPPNDIRSAVSSSALAFGAIFFILSTVILTEKRTASFRLGLVLTLPTLACIWVMYFHDGWLTIVAAVTFRQFAAIFAAMRARDSQDKFSLVVPPFVVITGGMMIYGAYTHEPFVLVSSLLFEMYVIAALDFRLNRWRRSIGTRTVMFSLAAWGASFPLAYWSRTLFPGSAISHDIWSLPHYGVAAGIILMIMEEDALRSEKRADEYRLLFDGHPNALWILDRNTRRFWAANQAAVDLHGYTQREFLRLRLDDVLASEQISSSNEELSKADPTPNRASMHVRKDGSMVPVDLAVHNIEFHGRDCRLVMATDVTEREALEKRLTEVSGHDHLTGLPNRSRVVELIKASSEAALRHGQQIAIVSIDIDRFKHINDSLGIETGDEYLQMMAAKLVNSVGAMNFVARTGGDEFMIVLHRVEGPSAVETYIRQVADLFREPTPIRSANIRQTLSIGVVMFPDGGTNVESLWNDAEIARMKAKKAGGDQTIWASDELKRAADEQRIIEDYMMEQIEDGGFHIVYQPLYGQDGRVASLEALLRLDHPDLGKVGPDQFIPIAEASGQIVPLGNWVIEEVCRQQLLWKANGVELVPVAINVSGKQLMNADFGTNLTSMLHKYEIDPHLIHLEVTESVALNDMSEIADRIASLAEQGHSFSIDDFGTGHSSFARLGQLGATTLKIDRSFLNGECQKNANAVVQGIITMAHALGHSVVAEGVETEYQLTCLCALGCDYLQGFLLSRPVPPERIPELIATSHSTLTDNDQLACVLVRTA